jgi:phosphoglycerate dehydrogenase-like enzyme
MRILYTQRHRHEAALEQNLGVRYCTLDELLAGSDFVSLHHRFDDSAGGNDRQFGAAQFARMKPTAFLINTARGRLVDEDALVAALQTDQIAGAGLDVFRHEPLPADHPFYSLAGDRLLLTPHVAGAPLAEAWQTVAEELIERVQAALNTGA